MMTPTRILQAFSEITAGLNRLGAALSILVSATMTKSVDVPAAINPVLDKDSATPVLITESALVTAPATPKATKSPKAVRDPNFPKRPLTAYLLFAREQRETIQKEHPEFGFPEVSRLLGQRWESVDKKKYEEENQKLMESYRRDVEEYQKSKTQTSEAEQPTTAVKVPKKNKKKAAAETVGVAEAVNATEAVSDRAGDKSVIETIPTLASSEADVEAVKPKKKKNKKAKIAEVEA
ncbi:High mobility group protein 20A [Paramicrosporidium saccamoebae]|uniref:High mobility group protein 20A n=1 Tax=Paramicrosporidium saccamoebae TaxID=1246581 RepID=A0A2H9TML4_9FUNG|nr:High mobility group protein 20A [Paramicrosporidium saccamoebae]